MYLFLFFRSSRKTFFFFLILHLERLYMYHFQHLSYQIKIQGMFSFLIYSYRELCHLIWPKTLKIIFFKNLFVRYRKREMKKKERLGWWELWVESGRRTIRHMGPIIITPSTTSPPFLALSHSLPFAAPHSLLF